MKILVTGGTGFIGSNLVKKLIGAEHEVRVIAKSDAKLNTLNGLKVDFRTVDVRDYNALEDATKDIDKIFHYASLFRTAGLPDQEYWDVHVKGTENLLKAALKNKIKRFIHCSTVGVHGHIKNPPASENTEFNPGDIYQITKLEGEKTARKFSQETGLPLVVVRPAPVYGPGDTRLLKLFKIAKSKISFIIGSGKIFFHMVYIDDLINGFILASEKDEALGDVFIIGSNETLLLNELVDLIADVTKSPKLKVHLPAKPFQWMGTICERICIPLHINPPIFRRRVDFFTKSRSFDISKAKKILQYEPKVILKEGLTKTAAWYVSNGFIK